MNKVANYRTYTFIAFCITCFGTGLRIIGLDKGLWLDEYYVLDIVASDNLVQSLRLHLYPPTYFVFLKLWSSLNAGEAFLRLSSVIFGVLTIVVVMAWIKSFSPSASLLAGLFVASSPILLRYSQEIQVYPLLLLVTAVSFFCAHRISRGNATALWYISLTIALSVAVTTHFVGMMIVTSICIYSLPALLTQRNRRQWVKLAVSVFIPVVLFALSYLLVTFGNESNTAGWMPPVSVDLVVSQFKYVMGVQYLFAPLGALGRYHPILALAYDSVVKVCLVLCVGSLLLFGDWRRSWVLLAAAVFYWFQIILYSLIFLPIFWYRSILPGIIPLIAFVAVQAATIRKKWLKAFTISGLVFLSLLSATGWLMTQAGVPQEPWKQVGQFVESKYRPGNLVAFYPSYIEGPTRYYLPTLQDENAIPIDLGTDIKTIDMELTRRMILSEDKSSPMTLFLIVRPDLSVQRDNVAYNDLLAYLESSAIHKDLPQDFKSVIVLRYDFQR